jgi:hypothetical protein
VKFAYSHPTAATCSQGGLDEYHRAPPHRGHVGILLNPRGLIVVARGVLERWAAQVMHPRE